MIFRASFVFLLIASICSLIDTADAQKTIAITIDDVPLNGPRIRVDDLRRMTARILDALRKHNAPAVAFVNESLVFVDGETDQRIAILRAWSEAGVELGNHNYAHMGFRDTPIERYEDDFVRGDAMISRISKTPVRYFRHPFLQMGPTLEAELEFEKFIGKRGYRIAPVTVETMDWMFLTAYQNAKRAGDTKMISDEYVQFAEAAIEFREKSANRLFGRDISHILLLHANELTAENMERLLQMYEKHGYRFVTLESALKDQMFALPEKYSPTSDWLLLWANSKGEKLSGPKPSESVQRAYADAQKK